MLGASAEEIRHAYRRLAHQAHPDVHPDDPGASQRFREITEAYQVLGDPERRAGYDLARRRSPSIRAVPVRVAASPTDDAVGLDGLAGPSGGRYRIVIGAGPVSTNSAPLIASPVRVVPPAAPWGPPAPPASRAPGSDLAGLLDALFAPWRWR